MTPEAPEPSDDLKDDPNYLAYQKALKAGDFAGMEPGTYVAFDQGRLVTSNTDLKLLFEELDKLEVVGLVHQVNVPERILHIPDVTRRHINQ